MPPAVKVKTASGWQDITYAGGPAVYEQTSDPGAVLVGSIWIDTDDSVTSAYTPPIGTVFPGSPFDGQEFVYNTGVIGRLWRFRYQADIPSAWKWVFQGGAALDSEVVTSEGTASTTYVDLTTVGPSVTAPLTGEYLIEWDCQMQNATAGSAFKAAPKLGAAATSDNDCQSGFSPAANNNESLARELVRTLTAADVVKLQYAAITSGTVNAYRRHLSLLPVRVLG